MFKKFYLRVHEQTRGGGKGGVEERERERVPSSLNPQHKPPLGLYLMIQTTTGDLHPS